MTGAFVTGRIQEATGSIKRVAGQLLGNVRREERGTAERNAADRKVLHEEPTVDVGKLA